MAGKFKRFCNPPVAAALAGVCLLAAPANAYTTGNQLHMLCSEPSIELACSFYIDGIVEVLSDLQAATRGLPTDSYQPARDLAKPFCLPENSTKGQVKDIVKRYLSEQPEKRHGIAWYLISVALQEAFPCDP